jgi:hypothetical protein
MLDLLTVSFVRTLLLIFKEVAYHFRALYFLWKVDVRNHYYAPIHSPHTVNQGPKRASTSSDFPFIPCCWPLYQVLKKISCFPPSRMLMPLNAYIEVMPDQKIQCGFSWMSRWGSKLWDIRSTLYSLSPRFPLIKFPTKSCATDLLQSLWESHELTFTESLVKL